jgi:hypothetical protein
MKFFPPHSSGMNMNVSYTLHNPFPFMFATDFVVGLALVGKNIVFRFIIEYSSLRDFGP